jgi:crossover junction endodeoxyribonuclease RuvC
VLALGIDPGTASTGYGLVRIAPDSSLTLVDFGVIRTASGDPMPIRLKTLHEAITGILQQHQPETSAVEKLFFQRNVTTAISVGQARGVALLALAEFGIQVGEYSPLEIKQAVVGYGGADKRQVQLMVQRLLALDEKPTPDDAADGLAVAICHLQVVRTEQHYQDAE